MNDDEFRAMVKWWMLSNPRPLDRHEVKTIENMILREAKDRGFERLADAYYQVVAMPLVRQGGAA